MTARRPTVRRPIASTMRSRGGSRRARAEWAEARAGWTATLGWATTVTAWVTTLVGAGPVEPVTAQESGALPIIALERVTVSADTIQLGDRFELRLDVRLAPGGVAYLPDSIAGAGFEPFGPVRWESGDPRDDSGIRLTIVYPLIAFDVGDVALPAFELYAAARDESVRAGMVDEEAVVGRFDAFVENVSLAPSARMLAVPGRTIQVVSVLHLEDMEYGIAPRPAADVAGGNRSWPATGLAVVFACVLLGVGTASIREYAARRAMEPTPAVSPRVTALAALDELLASDLLARGRIRDFFERSSSTARRFVESMDDAWDPSWTGSELADGLARRSPVDSTPLREEIATAEVVKFGGERPEPEAAVAHAHRLREWIASRGSDA